MKLTIAVTFIAGNTSRRLLVLTFLNIVVCSESSAPSLRRRPRETTFGVSEDDTSEERNWTPAMQVRVVCFHHCLVCSTISGLSLVYGRRRQNSWHFLNLIGYAFWHQIFYFYISVNYARGVIPERKRGIPKIYRKLSKLSGFYRHIKRDLQVFIFGNARFTRTFWIHRKTT